MNTGEIETKEGRTQCATLQILHNAEGANLAQAGPFTGFPVDFLRKPYTPHDFCPDAPLRLGLVVPEGP